MEKGSLKGIQALPFVLKMPSERYFQTASVSLFGFIPTIE